jgi:hypothetical protein
MYLAFTHYERPELASLGFVLALSVPLWCPPVARHFNMEPLMFDMFKKKPSNVVPFPSQPEHGGGDSPPPQEPKKPAVTYYSLGMTSENRLEFKMGYSAITMNYGGVSNLIEQLETFKKQLAQYEDTEEE